MSVGNVSEISRQDDVLIVSPASDRLNCASDAALTDEVLQCLRENGDLREMVLDLANVAWISSAGLNQLINLQAEARTLGIRIRVRNLCEVLREVFQLTRLERAFQCEERSGESPLISVR